MANDDIDLKQQLIKNNKGNNEFLKTITINIISTTLLCIIFICANFIIQTNLLNSKLATINGMSDDAGAMDEEDIEQVKHGVVVDLGDFVLNLADENQRRYLKTNIALEITQPEPDPAAEVKKEGGHGGHGGHGEEAAAPTQSALEKKLAEYKPAIRDAVITNLSSKTAVELSTAAGKELAKEQIMAAVNGILAGQNEVLRVSFGQFIIQ